MFLPAHDRAVNPVAEFLGDVVHGDVVGVVRLLNVILLGSCQREWMVDG